MGIFERYLTVWVGLGILAGVGLGLAAPALFEAVAHVEFAHVNLVVAVFIWVMIYPMMIQIDFAAVKDVGKRPRGLVLTLVIHKVPNALVLKESNPPAVTVIACVSGTLSKPGKAECHVGGRVAVHSQELAHGGDGWLEKNL